MVKKVNCIEFIVFLVCVNVYKVKFFIYIRIMLDFVLG